MMQLPSKRFSLFFLCIPLVTFLFCTRAVSADSDMVPIEYVYPDQSIWTLKKDNNGILANPLLKFAEALFADLQVTWKATPYPAKRMFNRLEQGVSNFSILVRASRLKECCLFSEKPVTYSELRVYRHTGTIPASTKEELKGKKVITIRGYSYGSLGRYLKDETHGITVYEAPGHVSAFEMLKHNRAEYLLDYSGPSEEVLAELPLQGIEHDTVTRLDVYLVLSKNYPDAQHVMKSLEERASQIDVTEWGLNRP